MSLEGKITLVTGASRGIGKAIALSLGGKGAVVLGTATSEAGAENISVYLRESGIQGKGYCLDVADQESVAAVFKQIKEEFGDVTVLVNNAGVTKDNLMLRMKADEWDQVINTNLSSIFRTSKAALKGMTKARWGRIINISSVIGSMGNAGQANYAAAKAGIEGFTRSLAKEVGSRAITVNAVAPGFIQTDMTHELPEEQKQALLQQVPLARLGEASEIAEVVGFLASDGASYVTGETIHVNGGMYMG
ncbi:3-oxoacyl-ACP reductase FabG [Gynuella sunshinyii]|uniref:3-oxoacyl-[acyl-carrier-protein] reductase n=1 Tax=Gynuella sunshinyii YC6258 TaxID=1445510 RepID=A0A0C5V7D3_9GAMM|nr:3-oxoacyl-ACP reductase FabG [Gynuella sunshinyii]AJQ95320.1 dehydrogenases with different specificities (related to short-chain alcohol dehydrogenase) [Gynuella sunshinyii YC6258]